MLWRSFDRKMKYDIQATKKKVDTVEEKSDKLNLKNLKLMEQMSLFEARVTELEKELANIKKELATQKASYESLLEYLQVTHQDQINALEKKVYDNYNEGSDTLIGVSWLSSKSNIPTWRWMN